MRVKFFIYKTERVKIPNLEYLTLEYYGYIYIF